MKFANVALGLIAASAALADTVKLEGDCKKAFEEYEVCGNTEASNFEDHLKLYQSEKCQNLYKDPIATLGKCGDLDAETKDKLIADVKFSQAYNILYTARDENNKACPLYRNNKVEKAKDTCASKKCTEASIEAYKLFAEGKKLNKNKESSIEVYNNILKALQECDGAAANGNADGASTVAGNSTEADAAAANGNNTANGNANGASANANTQVSVENSTSDATSIFKYSAALALAAVYLLF